jgi:hypothetical protein
MVPSKLNDTEDGSGTAGGSKAVKLPDCDEVMLLPDVKSAGWQIPVGHKYSWILRGVGARPSGSLAVRNSEKPPR